MALFKILNNFSSGRSVQELTSHNAGYCYFDKTTGKFWVDTSSNAADMLQLGGTFFGTCSTTGSLASKAVADCPGFVLYTGASIYVKFTETNTSNSSSLTLNVNGTGAKAIKQYGTTNLLENDIITAGMVCNFVYDGTNWLWVGQVNTDTDTVPSAYCNTIPSLANKVATCTNYTDTANSYVHVLFRYANNSAGALYLNINDTGAKPIYINGTVTNQTNYTLPAGTYLAFYDGIGYHIRTDGVLPGVIAGNVKSISNNGSVITYTMGDDSTHSFVVPNTKYTAGQSIDITNNQITNMGVRVVSTGSENGTISVTTGNTTTNVAVNGLGTAAYSSAGSFASNLHSHGNISTNGKVEMTSLAIGDGDSLLVADASDEDKLIKTTITFDGTTTNQFLTKAGTWEGAEVYSHPAYTARPEGFYKVTVDNRGHVSNVSTVAKADITALGIPAQDTTYDFDGEYNATTNKAATVDSIVTRIANLDGVTSGTPGAGKTLTAFSETDGIVSATFGNISITKSQISDFAHTHSYAGAAESGGNAYTANYAITANNAVHAASTDSANEAVHAASATYAASSKTASFAITAGRAVSAASAGYATTAANAVNAVEAIHASSASYAITASAAVYSASAGYALTANSANTSGTANWAVTASNAKWAQSANYAVTAGQAITAANAVQAEKDASGNVITTTYATKDELNSIVASADALVYKGLIGTGSGATPLPPDGYEVGWTYRVVTAGTYAGKKCEVGDLIIAVHDSTGVQDDSHWTVVQTNIDGAVITAQTSSTSGSLAIFTGTSGKAIAKVSGVGSSTNPIYIDSNGVPQAITSYEGQAGSAGYATTAARAIYAASAGYALSSGSAGYATSASQATHSASANYASSAAQATHAASANYAISSGSAGYATSASQATYAASAGYTLSAGSAGYASSAARATYSASAGYAVKSASAGYATSAAQATYAASAGYALKASQDEAGNSITGTYVHKAGDTMEGRLIAAKGFQNLLTGTGTAGVNNSGVYTPVKWTFNSGITATDGDIFTVKIPNTTNADWGIFMSVDNGTTYYPVASNNKSRLTTHFPVNTYVSVVFEATGAVDSVYPLAGASSRSNLTGGCWRVINFYDSNTLSQIRNENGRIYAGATGINPYSIVGLDNSNKYSMLVANSTNAGTGTSKTMNTSGKFKLPATILYYGANNTAAANTLVSSTYATYSVYTAVDTRYSHNHTTTFTANTPLYIECTIDANGYWSPTTVGITQTFTSGKYYIYLGVSYSTEYQLSLAADHPCYYYDGTNLTEYTRQAISMWKAGSAGYATSALQSVYAASAGYSLSAGSAGYAASAAQATHAASAGYSVSANQATYAASAGYALSSGSAGYATSASQATHSASAQWAVSAGSAGYASSAARATYAASASYASSAAQATHAASAGYATTASFASDPTKLPLTGGVLTGDLYLATTASGATPAIIFQRGDFTDSYNDWRIHDDGGMLYFGQRGSSSTDFDSAIYLDNVGGVHATTFAGKASCATYALSSSSAGYSASAARATYAASANYATSASRATYSASAGYALTADAANNANTATASIYAASAGYALTADSANIAGSATTAAQAVHAASANYSLNAASATYAVSSSSAGSAGYAASAAQATHSASAGYALSAGSAGYAASAAQATYAASAGYTVKSGSAGYAASAAQATHAASATYSLSAGSAGYAAAALEATHSACATWSLSAGSAGYASSAAQATHSASAGYALSAGSAGYASSAAQATHAASAGYALSAGSAGYASSAARATYAASATYTLSAGSAGYAASAAQATHSASASFAQISSTNSVSKLYMLGATSQANSVTSYSYTAVYATEGALAAKSYQVAEKAIIQYNVNTNALDFVFI